ncbi:MAG: type II secretion system protein [Candidatus Gastranaerophilaceae bacterium]|jgi:prepilin-type N-terminal cleavage/methylation domain-containing protein
MNVSRDKIEQAASCSHFLIKRKGFTLAEVLLTLTIIGIIAAMTIPGLMNSTQKMENVVALKKAFSTLSQATLFIPKLNVAKICGTNNPTGGCFPNLKYKFGDGITEWENISTTVSHSTILTNDGMAYSFALFDASCSLDKSDPVNTTSSPLYNFCGLIYVDINGPNKGPATTGRDLFCFVLTKKGTYPFGAYPYRGVPPDCPGTNGSSCTNKVLLEGAINY